MPDHDIEFVVSILSHGPVFVAQFIGKHKGNFDTKRSFILKIKLLPNCYFENQIYFYFGY